MKNLIIALFCVLSFQSKSQTTTQRLILVEEFTNASCTPCALSNPAFETLMNANSTKVIPIKYHTSFPGYDPFYSSNTTQNQARSVFYSVTAVPTARMDGAGILLQDVNQTSINTEYAVPATFSITLSWKYSSDADSIYVTAAFKSLQAITATLAGQIAIIEKSVNYLTAPGSNGEKDFTNVMRKMLPSQTGTILPATMVANQIVTVSTGMSITSGFVDISKIAVIAFVQDNTTKSIKQAAYSGIPTVVPVNPLILLGSKSNPVCSNNGSIDISVIGASGVYSYNWSNGATTQDISNLAVGTYSVTVTSGIKVSTASFSLTQGTLSTPTSVITSSITSCSAILSWAATSGASSYSVKYKPASSTTWSTPINVTGTNFTFTGLAASTQYNFSVAGVCSNGSMGSSATYTATTASCTTPTNPTSTLVTATSATLNWTAGCNPTSYEIQYMIQGSTTWTIATSIIPTKTLTGLTPSKIYQYKIRTLCGATYTAFSTVKTFVTPASRIEEIIPEIEITLFPNPFETSINLSFPATINFNKEISVTGYDVLGRKCFDMNNVLINNGIGKIEIPSDINTGIYLIEIKGENFLIQKPMVKL